MKEYNIEYVVFIGGERDREEHLESSACSSAKAAARLKAFGLQQHCRRGPAKHLTRAAAAAKKTAWPRIEGFVIAGLINVRVYMIYRGPHIEKPKAPHPKHQTHRSMAMALIVDDAADLMVSGFDDVASLKRLM